MGGKHLYLSVSSRRCSTAVPLPPAWLIFGFHFTWVLQVSSSDCPQISLSDTVCFADAQTQIATPPLPIGLDKSWYRSCTGRQCAT